MFFALVLTPSIIVDVQNKNFIVKKGNYCAWYNEDAYYTFFLRGLLKNHRCYFCDLRRATSADIRIGDCMAKKYEKLSFSPSTIIANSEKGRVFLQDCTKDLEVYKDEYEIVDQIQEKINQEVPKDYERNIALVQEGYCPEQLIKRTMISGRIKSLLKNRILRKFKSEQEVNLEECVKNKEE